MNVREMARAIADQHNLDVKDVQKVLYGISGVVVEQVSRGATVRLGSLGTFYASKKAARRYKNIKTGAIEVKPEHKDISFRRAAKLKML